MLRTANNAAGQKANSAVRSVQLGRHILALGEEMRRVTLGGRRVPGG